MEKRLPIPQMLITISTTISLVYLFIFGKLLEEGDFNMNTAGVIAVVVAIIVVAGGIWAQLVQFKRDSTKIDSVGSRVGEVKADTSEIRPQVNNIHADVRKIRDEILEKLIPNMGKLSGIEKLVAEMEYNKRLKAEACASLASPEYLVGSIQKSYERNAFLEVKTKELEREKNEFLRKNQILESENNKLKEDLRKRHQQRESGHER